MWWEITKHSFSIFLYTLIKWVFHQSDGMQGPGINLLVLHHECHPLWLATLFKFYSVSSVSRIHNLIVWYSQKIELTLSGFPQVSPTASAAAPASSPPI